MTRYGSPVDPVRRTEAWFARNGLPRFVEDYTSAEHIWTRALPALIVVLAVQVASALASVVLGSSRSVAVVTVVLAGLALLAVGVWSKYRRGYWFAPLDRVGWPVLAGFVLVGLLADLIEAVGQDEPVDLMRVSDAVLGQLFLLGVIYLITRFALISMIGWGIRQTIRSARDLYLVATKALPLLLIVLIVLFINTEVWQVSATMDFLLLWASSGLLLLLGLLVTLERTTTLIDQLDPASDMQKVRSSCIGSPLEEQAKALSEVVDPRLGRTQKRNLAVAAIATQAIQAALIGLLVWVFFIVFGVIAINAAVQATWIGDLAPTDVFWTVADGHVISRPLIRVATFLGAFAAFYTTVYAATDDVYRASFSDDVGASLQEAVDVRRVYLTVKSQSDA